MSADKVKAILDKAVADAKDHFPSEEITYTEMMENLAHARREAERKGQKRS
jgi:hemerythrin